MIQSTLSDFQYSIGLMEQKAIFKDLLEQPEDPVTLKMDHKNQLITNIRKMTEEENIDSDEENKMLLNEEHHQEEMSKKYILQFQDQYK